jgi:oligopeptide/dipeptide ABC transporter ATP-binding protein
MIMVSNDLNNNKSLMVRVDNLSVNFPVKKNTPFGKKKYVQAVTDVSITINKGETFGLVGESGCGKTTLANAVLGIISPSSGKVIFKDRDMNNITRKEFIELRRDMQMIFQDPYSSLNPRFSVFSIIAEPFVIRGGFSKEEIKERVEKLIELVGLSKDDLYRYPSDFSGGQRQRIGIARAIALNPEFLVCDEPVSALDVSVHAQILNLLMNLQKELGLTYLFISHNLAVVKKICSNLAVMYLGKIVEYGSTEAIFKNPLHPYTRALMSAVLDIDIDNKRERIILKGEIPSPIDPPEGCRFSQRCYEKMDGCSERLAELKEIESNHFVACCQYK